ncbi:hypothetical protein GCM10023175_56800 [Pseudonocardia xishanensis]|uniref:Uncharacterized protein n=1 Tax=Pseudonocardia xishanensis TaxID=630995 RepID=A0ABP8S0J7_9PSEU
MALGEQPGDEPRADIAGRTDHETTHGSIVARTARPRAVGPRRHDTTDSSSTVTPAVPGRSRTAPTPTRRPAAPHAQPTATEPGEAGTAGDRAACVTVDSA